MKAMTMNIQRMLRASPTDRLAFRATYLPG